MRIMKKQLLVALVALAGLSGCAAMAAHQKKIDTARSACYQLPEPEVYKELYSVVAAEYKITRESESRGFIETDWKEETIGDTTYRRKAEAEVVGGSCVRVVIKLTGEEVDTKTGASGTYDARADEDNLYLAVNERLAQRAPAGGGADTAAAPQ
jgi:uncharacterized lipoprotein